MRGRETAGIVAGIAVIAAVAGPARPAGAQTGEERRAYSALSSAADAFDRAGGGAGERLAAARRVLAEAERAHRAFRQADGRRDGAADRYVAAVEHENRLAVNCETRRCSEDPNLIDFYPGVHNDRAASNEARAALSSAHADYVEAVGLHDAGRWRQAAASFRRFANRYRGLPGGDADTVRRRNALVREEHALIDQFNESHRRATAAHVAANGAALRALAGAARTVLAAADRLTQAGHPGTGAAAVDRARTALDRAAGNAIAPGVEDDSGRTDAAVEAVMTALRVTVDVLDGHVRAVEQEVAALERRTADADGGWDEPAGGGAFPPDAGGEVVETPAPRSAREWLGDVMNLLGEVERYVAAAERTEGFLSCSNVETNQNIASIRLNGLVVGAGRPRFIPAEVGWEAWERIRERDRAAQDRVAEICRSRWSR